MRARAPHTLVPYRLAPCTQPGGQHTTTSPARAATSLSLAYPTEQLRGVRASCPAGPADGFPSGGQALAVACLYSPCRPSFYSAIS
eukprot:6922161-Prymnesium_polylepis.1